ncbi:cupin domain-containing protein [Paenibacillus aurantius]|uniref:Cupin domain-containing protein n=1 Tax=Paenibacillus aurantius TaxID=2918900 RepID=A0AA96LD81_9BACL|nr:cupin domain-containing protein [Paenibacillus aurantius]WNQ11190.1 cupin domain-containing protein [Paenibacillus aurantius]
MEFNKEWQPAEPGVRRRIVTVGRQMMSMIVEFEAGAEGYVHSHPHEQTTYVIRGEFAFTIDGTVHQVREGDTLYIPSDAKHGVTAVTAGALFDTFTPIREDLLKR